jgi:hypothetical protein
MDLELWDIITRDMQETMLRLISKGKHKDASRYEAALRRRERERPHG